MDQTNKESSLEATVFREKYYELSRFFGSSNESINTFTDILYSKGVIDKSVKDEIHTTTGISAQEKARRLLDSFDKTLHHSSPMDRNKLFKTFCLALLDISENLKSISDEMIKEYETREQAMVPKEQSQSLLRALSSCTADIPDTADVPDLNNTASQIFKHYYDDLVDAIKDADTANKMATDLCTYKLISIAEKDRVYKLSSVPIKVKAMFSSLGVNIERRRKDNNQFAKFLELLHNNWNDMPALSVLEDKMRREAIILPVKLQSEVSITTLPAIEESTNSRMSENIHSTNSIADDDKVTILKYKTFLQRKYEMIQKPDNKWLSEKIQRFVDLAVIMKSDLPEDDEFSRSTIHGNIEDILHKKEKISYEDLKDKIKCGSRFLVEGAPGIGKSTLALEFCKRWKNSKKGELFSEYDLFVMLRLRDKTVQEAKDPSDLFPSDDRSLGENVFKVVRSQGSNLKVFIILEGFDELPKNLRQNESIFTKLIDGSILSAATVMVTTRHSATEELLNLVTIEFSLRLEILGFSHSSVNEYISASFKRHDDISALNDYLDHFPHVKGCLYVPLNLAILIKIFAQKQRPETLTDLYIAIVKAQLLRYLNDKNFTLKKIEDLKLYKKRPELFPMFCKVCKFAYDMLCNNQTLVFQHHDLSKDDQETVTQSLDLILGESHSQVDSGIIYSYSFPHLTIQEFLAAYHISQLSEDEQQHIYECLAKNSSFVVVLRFLAGLTGLKSITLTIPDEVSDFNLIQQLFESQNKVLTRDLLTKPDDKLQRIFRTWPMPTLQDFYAVGWCIRLSNCKWDLGFTFRALLSNHIVMLKKGIGDNPTGQIEMIKIQLNPIGSEGFSQLLAIAPKALQNVCILGLRGTNLDSSACNTLASKFPSLFSCLQMLSFHDNPIEYDGHQQLIEALCNVPSLKLVSFSKLSPTECSTLLTETNIESIELWQLSHDSVQIISYSIATAKSCLALCVSDSEITVEDIDCIPQSLQANTTLQSLELINCGISCTTAKIIAEAVTNNTSIARLNLDNNLIRDTGINHIVCMLQTRKLTFEKININRNPIGKESLEEIVRAISQSYPTSVAELTVSLKWKEYICSHFDCKNIECKLIFK